MPDFLKKIQNLPEEKRKIILWAVVVTIGAIFFFVWLKGAKTKLETFQKEEFFEQIRIPELQEELKRMPITEFSEIDFPELTEEEMEELETLIEEEMEKELQNNQE